MTVLPDISDDSIVSGRPRPVHCRASEQELAPAGVVGSALGRTLPARWNRQTEPPAPTPGRYTVTVLEGRVQGNAHGGQHVAGHGRQ